MPERKLIAVLLLLALFTGPLRIFCFAAGETTAPAEEELPRLTVVADTAMPHLAGKIDFIDTLDTYASEALWSASQNTDTVASAASFPDYPFDPMEGTRCIEAAGSNTGASLWRYAEYIPPEPIDLSGYAAFFCAVSVPYLSEGKTKILLSLYSAGNVVFSAVSYLTPETWNGVFADISEVEGRSEITGIRIGVQHAYPEAVNYAYSFRIDCLAASRDRYLARSVLFMSGSYLVYGGESSLSYTYNPMKIGVSISSTPASECFIESRILHPESFAAANAIRVRLANRSSCTAVTMHYATETSPVYADNRPVTAAADGGADITAYYFPLPPGGVTQVKFTFNGASEGKVDLYSITPVLFYAPLSGEYAHLYSSRGKVNTCRLTDGGRKIFIAGTLTDEGVALYTGSRIELYELKPWQSSEYIFDSESIPIASAGVSAQFSFEIPSSDKTGSRVHSKFVTVIYNKDKKQTVMLDSPHYITNPEITAAFSSVSPVSVKGLISSASVLAEANVSQTALELNLAELPAGPSDSISYTFEDREYYFNPAFIEKLDRQMNDYSIAGVSVVFVMTLNGFGNSEYSAPLMHGGATVRTLNESYAFNTDTEEGTALLRASCDFLARRYMTDGPGGNIIGITVGSNIDSAYVRYNMGKKTLADFADSYCRTFRIVYNTIRSVNSGVAVYVSAGSSWDRCLDSGPAYAYCGRDLTDIIAEQLRREGAVAWHLAADPYPIHSGGMTDRSTGETGPQSHITVNNLPALCRYLRREKLLHENSSRRVLLISSGGIYGKENAGMLAAEYAAAYYTVTSDSCSAVSGFIPADNPAYRASGYDFIKILKYIDTSRSEEFTAFAREIFGISDWKELIPSARSAAQTGRLLQENTFYDNLPEAVTGTVPLFGFEDAENLKHWTPSSSVVSMTAPNDFKGYRDMLFAEFGALTSESFLAIKGGFGYTRDLSFAPYLSFDLYTDNLPSSLRTLTLTVTVTSPDAVFESRGIIRGGVWRYVVCDLSGFSALKNITGVTLRLSDPGGGDLSGAKLVIGEISVSSLRYDNDFLENKFREERDRYLSAGRIPMKTLLIWISAGVILTALIIEAININNRLKTIEEENKKHDRRYKKKY